MVVNNHFLATTAEIPIQVILLSVLQNDENIKKWKIITIHLLSK